MYVTNEGVWSKSYPGMHMLQLDFWCSDNWVRTGFEQSLENVVFFLFLKLYVAILAVLGYSINCCKAFTFEKQLKIISAIRWGFSGPQSGVEIHNYQIFLLDKFRPSGLSVYWHNPFNIS